MLIRPGTFDRGGEDLPVHSFLWKRRQYSNVWEEYAAPVCISDGKQVIYLTYRGGENASLLSLNLQ